MTARIIHVGKKAYVTNVFWYHPQPVEATKGKSFRQEILQIANETDPPRTLYVRRREGRFIQIGFLATISNEVKPGARSAGAAVAYHLVSKGHRTAICAIKADEEDLWLLVVILQGNVVHDGDRSGTEDEMRQVFDNAISNGIAFQAVYVPESWGYQGSLGPGSASMLSRGALPALVITPNRTVPVMIGGAIIVMGLAVAGGYKYMQSQQTPPPPPPPRPRVEIAKPWVNKPRVMAGIKACMNPYYEYGRDFGGWDLEKVECKTQENAVALTWVRSLGAQTSGIQSVIPGVVLALDQEPARATLRVGIEPTLARVNESAPELTTWKNEIFNRFAAINLKPVGLPAQPTREAEMIALPWVDSAETQPLIFGEIMDGEASTLTSVTGLFSKGTPTWTLEGTQYAR